MAKRSRLFYVLTYAFSGSWKRVALEITYMSLFVAFFLWGALRVLSREIWWEERGEETTARITVVEKAFSVYGGPGIRWRCPGEVTYRSADGRSWTAQCDFRCRPGLAPEPGEPQRILYDSEDPSRILLVPVREMSSSGQRTGGSFIIVVAVILCLIGIWRQVTLWRTAGHRKHLIDHGDLALAQNHGTAARRFVDLQIGGGPIEGFGGNAITTRRLRYTFEVGGEEVHGFTSALPRRLMGRWRLRPEFPVAYDPTHPERNEPIFFGERHPPESYR